MDTKICIKCGAELNLSLFGKKQDSKDGYKNECKECRKERMKQYYQDHKEHVKQYNKEYYQDNKECHKECMKQYRQDNKEYIIEHAKQYYQDNKEHIIEHAKQYHQDNKEYIAECERQYRQDNKEHIAEHAKQYSHEHLEEGRIRSQKRRALKSGLLHTLTTKQWKNIKTHFNNKCAYCNRELPLTQEHFIPLSKNGEYTVNNIIPACGSCNSSKGAKLLNNWYPKYKYFSEKRELKILDYLKEKEG